MNVSTVCIARLDHEVDALPDRYVAIGQFALYAEGIRARINRLEGIVLAVGGTTIVMLLSVLGLLLKAQLHL